MKAIIDSDVLIDFLQGVKSAQTELAQYRRREISIVSWMEVMAGAEGEDDGSFGRLNLLKGAAVFDGGEEGGVNGPKEKASGARESRAMAGLLRGFHYAALRLFYGALRLIADGQSEVPKGRGKYPAIVSFRGRRFPLKGHSLCSF